MNSHVPAISRFSVTASVYASMGKLLGHLVSRSSTQDLPCTWRVTYNIPAHVLRQQTDLAVRTSPSLSPPVPHHPCLGLHTPPVVYWSMAGVSPPHTYLMNEIFDLTTDQKLVTTHSFLLGGARLAVLLTGVHTVLLPRCLPSQPVEFLVPAQLAIYIVC